MLVRGRVTYLIGSRKVRVPVGKMTAFWAAMPHQIVDYDRETDYFVATLPLAWFLQCQLSDNLVQPLMRGEAVNEPLTSRAEFDAKLFQQWEGDLQKGGREMREIVIQEMTTRLRRLAVTLDALKAGTSERAPARIQAGRLNKVEQIVCYIAQHYAQPITVTDIGHEVGLHPNSAMRLFKRVFGTTLVNHLTHHRIFHAKRLLATTDQKIVDVAFGSGFSSISRIN
jgi:AraC-like DNA-binding protein